MPTEIQTPRDLIDTLGGVTKAAVVLEEKHPSTISNWVRAGAIPSNKYRKHKARLDELKIVAPDSLWFDEAAA